MRPPPVNRHNGTIPENDKSSKKYGVSYVPEERLKLELKILGIERETSQIKLCV